MTEPIDYISMSDVLDAAIEEGGARLWVCLAARVTAIDGVTHKATVQPIRKDPADPTRSLPPIPNLPLRSEKSNQAANGALWIPIGVGELVMVHFLTHPIDQWLTCETPGDDVGERKGGRWRGDYSSAYYERGISQSCEPLPSFAVHPTSPVLSGDPVLLGDSTAASFVALADEVNARNQELKDWITEVGPTGLGAQVAAYIASGGLTPIPGPVEWLAGVPAVDASKVKAK